MKRLQFCLVLLCTLMLALGAFAQVQNGQFTGEITDPSGAAIANAKVTVINTGTNLTQTVTTNQAGLFTAKELPVGTYKITVEAQGFKTVQNTSLTMNAVPSSTSTSRCSWAKRAKWLRFQGKRPRSTLKIRSWPRQSLRHRLKTCL